MTIEPQDHGGVAWSHILIQFRDSPVLEGFIKSLYQPVNALHQALTDLLDRRTLDTATGAQLDGIGEIVGVKRMFQRDRTEPVLGFKGQPQVLGFGQAPFVNALDSEQQAVSKYIADEDYRSLIRLKIALNNGHATVAEIHTAMKYVFNASQIIIEETGNAALKIYFGQASGPAFALAAPESFIPRAAGVRLEMYGELSQRYFGFRGGLNTVGFGQAPFIQVEDRIHLRIVH
ncbi:MAG: DUF2612 domain-containing protein [Candidatus Symbiopectobacterium sp. Dall1.0]|nr:DUF2612 domain-containing protein [Candidatus Symbiopectobacterium sp. Dall1.0]